MSSSRVFLVNPASDNGSTGRRWPELARRAAALGLTGDALISERPGELPALAQRAVAEGARLLVVVGGDGTLNEVVNGVAGASGVEVAVLPRGTGVDFVRSFAIPKRFEDAVRVALEGRTVELDLGRASFRTWDGDRRNSHFANIASAGMSGAIAKRTNETTKAFGGKASYALATLAIFSRWRSARMRVSVDGQEREEPMHDVVVANGRYFGSGMMICPEADPADGLLDVLLIGDLSKRDLILTLPKTYRGKHLPHRKAELLRGACVTVDADEPLPIELDGEQPGTTPASFEVVPAALRLRVAR